MGTKMAPAYATPVMGYLEKEVYSRYEDTFGNKDKDNFVKFFKRFLDDCFIIWEGSEENLMTFYYLLNDLYGKIQFTMEKDNKNFHFSTFYYTRTEESYTKTFLTKQQTRASI